MSLTKAHYVYHTVSAGGASSLIVTSKEVPDDLLQSVCDAATGSMGWASDCFRLERYTDEERLQRLIKLWSEPHSVHGHMADPIDIRDGIVRPFDGQDQSVEGIGWRVAYAYASV